MEHTQKLIGMDGLISEPPVLDIASENGAIAARMFHFSSYTPMLPVLPTP